MDLTAVNTFGSLAGDKGRFLGKLARFLPVGFYYKAFHSKLCSPVGTHVPLHDRPRQGGPPRPAPRTPKAYDFCDVLVIGAGPSGLSAAWPLPRPGCAGGHRR
jgi:sarcosine oxidase subunit alpha